LDLYFTVNASSPALDLDASFAQEANPIFTDRALLR
jgi:hypothetical protein